MMVSLLEAEKQCTDKVRESEEEVRNISFSFHSSY